MESKESKKFLTNDQQRKEQSNILSNDQQRKAQNNVLSDDQQQKEQNNVLSDNQQRKEQSNVLSDDQQRKALTDILKSLCFDSMGEGKYALKWLLYHNELDGHIAFNTLMQQLNREKISYGWDWGWKNLDWDILSNKYGVAALRDERKKQTYFTLRLPPVVKLDRPKVTFDESFRYCFDPTTLYKKG